MKKFLTIIGILCFWAGSVLAQTVQVSGTVTGADDGQPLPGVSVVVKGTIQGTVTNVNGKYSISAPADATLQFSFVGMETQEVAISGRQIINVDMSASAHELDEVVVTALGITRAQKTLGYSATTVKGDELSIMRNSNVVSSLSGKVAGLQVNASSSDPGMASGVIIRGFSSINGSNQPLYIVDGVPLQNSTLQTSGHSIDLSGIGNIAADDIESTTILKGAAATALYGSRAANGVVVITTKKGAKGETRNFYIEYNGGLQARVISVLPTFQNDFGQGWNGAQTFIENGSWGPRFNGSMQVYGPIWNGQQLLHKYEAVKDNVRDFFETGITHNHNISLSGISDDNKFDYFLSYSYVSDDGIIPTKVDKYDRNTLAFRSGMQATDWLKMSTSINYAKYKTDAVGSYQGASMIDGILEHARDVSLVDKKDLSSPFNTPEAYYTPYGITNPYWAIANNYNHTDGKQLYGKLQADVNPIKNLTLTYRFGFDYSDYDMKMGDPLIALDDDLIDEDFGYAPSHMNQDGYVYARYSRSYETNHDFMANYKRDIDRFSINVYAGLNLNERASTYMFGQADVLAFNGFWQLSNGANWTSLTESQSKRRLVGLFGDVTVGFDNMLFLNLTARNDWSSTLPIDNNSFFYPGATLSWIFTEILPYNNILSFGKLRLAYGQTGNDAGVYQVHPSFNAAYADATYGANVAKFPMNATNAFLAATRAGSSTLQPEISTEFEIGANLQFLKGRVGLDVAYYDRVTDKQIFSLPVDPITGYSSMVTNFGKISNKGIEILLSTTPVKTRNFQWDFSVNFARNRNKVISLPEELATKDEEGNITDWKVSLYSFSAGNDAVFMYAEIDKPMGIFYTYLPQFTDDGSPIVNRQGQPELTPTIEANGYDIHHKWTGGATTAVTAYGVTLSATLDVRYGGHMFSRTKNLMQFTGNALATTYNDRNPFIIPNSVVANGDGTYRENTTPIYQSNGSYQNYFNDYGACEGGNFYMLDRSFVKLRNIALSWELPATWVKPLMLSSISVSAFVNNAFVWTAKGNRYIDPEGSTIGTDLTGQFGEMYVNPACRIFGCNLRLKF